MPGTVRTRDTLEPARDSTPAVDSTGVDTAGRAPRIRRRSRPEGRGHIRDEGRAPRRASQTVQRRRQPAIPARCVSWLAPFAESRGPCLSALNSLSVAFGVPFRRAALAADFSGPRLRDATRLTGTRPGNPRTIRALAFAENAHSGGRENACCAFRHQKGPGAGRAKCHRIGRNFNGERSIRRLRVR